MGESSKGAVVNHIMIDLETLGVGTFPALLSIGAVVFDPESGVLPPTPNLEAAASSWMMRLISVESCLRLGATVSDSTLACWASPELDAARPGTFGGTYPIKDAINDLNIFVCHYGAQRVWFHGLTFDVAILTRYAELVGLSWQFDYRAGRDTRTLFDLAPEVVREAFADKPSEFIKHNAVWDAWLQAKAVCKVYAELRNCQWFAG